MLNILVVEDDVKLNQIVCTYLNDNGYNAKGALSAREAYDLMYNAIYDLIISDIMMPDIDGFEFAETVRGINKTIPILFMTARDDFSSKQKEFNAGIDDYMVKPLNMDELEKIKEWVGHSEIGTTNDTYGHWEFGTKIEAADTMASLYNPTWYAEWEKDAEKPSTMVG